MVNIFSQFGLKEWLCLAFYIALVILIALDLFVYRRVKK